GDGAFGPATGRERGQVPAHRQAIDALGTVEARALGPLDETRDVAPIGRDGARGHARERCGEVVDPPGHAATVSAHARGALAPPPARRSPSRVAPGYSLQPTGPFGQPSAVAEAV